LWITEDIILLLALIPHIKSGEDNKDLPKSEVFDIYCKTLINSFNLMDQDYLPVGIGLYLEASVLDHSCWPNATVVFDGKTADVRALEDISDFSQVRISYTDVKALRSVRREELRSQYYFDCDCPECRMENSGSEKRERLKQGSVRCPECGEDVAVDSGVPDCPECQARLPLEEHKRLSVVLREKVFGNAGCHPEPMEQCRDLYPELKEVLSPCDSGLTRVLEHLYESHIEANEWERAYEVGTRALEAYLRLCPQHDVNVATMALKVGKLASHLELDQKAMTHLKLAKTQLRITHGSAHPVYSRNLTALIAELELLAKLHPDSLKPPEAIQHSGS